MQQTSSKILAMAMIVAVWSVSSHAQTHPEVQAALDWQLPTNECKKPPSRLETDGIAARGGLGIAGIANSDGMKDAKLTYPTNSIPQKTIQRKEARWLKCEKAYGQSLVTAFQTLKTSAQYGLTEPQAKQILQKMAGIQTVLRGRYEQE